MGFSITYFYELYLHNEYYNEPPGFPARFEIMPLIASFKDHGNQWWEKRFTGGVAGALRLTHHHAWIELIAAIGQEKVRFNHQGSRGEQSRCGGDDFLIDIGYNFLIDKKGKAQLLLHWLTGIPTRWKVSLAEVEEPLIGTRTFATGPVIEFSYDFIRNPATDFFIGIIGRFLHRFKRSYQPILPLHALFHPGNTLDVLALIHYRHYGHNIEFGYVDTLFIDSSYQFPHYREPLPAEQFNSVYIDYSYYDTPLAMGFEAGIVATFGKTSTGTSLYGSIAWYF